MKYLIELCERIHIEGMATNTYHHYYEMDDAILLQAENSVTYSPSSADSPTPPSPILLDPGSGLDSLTKPSPHHPFSLTLALVLTP